MGPRNAAIWYAQDGFDPTAKGILAMARMVLGNLHRDHGLLDHALPCWSKMSMMNLP